MASRRTFINQAGKLTAAASLIPFLDMFTGEQALAFDKKHASPADAATDEDYWTMVRQGYSSLIISILII